MVLYQILMALALPFLAGHALIKGGWPDLKQRLGLAPKAQGSLRLWLHGASLGELTSARWVIEELLAARPDLRILITANTRSGRDMVAGWQRHQVLASLAPLDSGGAAGRFLDRWRPDALVIVENELWPVRLAAAHRRGIPVLVIGARLSERSARRWRWMPGLIGATLGRIDWLSAQDDASARRLAGLGLPLRAQGPIMALKSQASAAPLPAPFPAPVRRQDCLLAASTHDDEERAVLAAFKAARTKGGPQFLILAPRHPQRSDEIAALIGQAGLSFARWSRAEVPGPETRVLLADTLGDMAIWYAMAGTCIIGGTFVPRGGHTPFEPAQYGCALIHGPHVGNFAPQFAALDRGGGAIALSGEDGLAAALMAMSAAEQVRLSAAATRCLEPFSQGAGAVTARLLAALPASARRKGTAAAPVAAQETPPNA